MNIFIQNVIKMKKKCRVFTTSIGWSDVMFIFDEKTKFSDIKNNPQTHMLTKEDYIGTYEFDKNFINCFNSSKLAGKVYFYRFSYQKDAPPSEEKDWVKIPEFIKTEKNIEHKNIEVKPGQVNASNFTSLFD